MNINILFLNLNSRDVVINYDFLIDNLLSDYQKNIDFLNAEDVADQKYDVLIYSCRNPGVEVHFGYAPPYEVVLDVVKRVKPKIIIQLSDEFWQENNDIHNQLGNYCDLFIKQHFHWNQNYTENTIQLPLAYVNDFKVDLENIIPINDRKYFWSWVGYLKSDRQEMINAFMRIWYNICACNGGLSAPEIADLYQNSKFVPIGRGNSSVDCWRIYEAIVSGAIPVIVSYENEIKSSFRYNEPLPALFASSWNEAVDLCIGLSEDSDALIKKQEELLTWWKNTVSFIKEKIDEVFNKNSVSVICACKNRNDALQISLRSWLNFKEITEIVIVDWNSDKSIRHLAELDERIKIVSVSDKKYFNQPQPLNLAARIAKGKYLLKLDCDYILNPYFKFFENDHYLIDDKSFVCGENTVDKGYDPYYKYLFGFLYIEKENFMKVNGFSEIFRKWYASEDQDIMVRLENFGLKKRGLDYDHNVIHIPHPDKKRTENFEAMDIESQYRDEIKQKLVERGFDGEELEWQTDFSLANMHVNANQGWISEMESDYIYADPMTEWKITQVDSQYYEAEEITEIIEDNKDFENFSDNILDNKLKNFPVTYYVSLEESKDRQTNIINQFKQYGVSPYGVISKRFSECDDVLTGEYLHQLNEGTAGCCVSHLKAIKHWYENFDDDYAFFCEDDLSLETVKYWDFTWEEFIESIPEDADIVQLLTIRDDFGDFQIRERYWDDWGATAYIITRDYAKKIIDTYINGDNYDTFHLEIPNSSIMPLIENILFTTLGKCYTVPLFVEDTQFDSTFSKEQDDDVNQGQKRDHLHASKKVLEYWKTKNIPQDSNMVLTYKDELHKLITLYSIDTENPIHNFNLGMWYENNGHTAPALSYYLRCAERSEDLDLAYEALIRGSYCYEKQGTRDETVKCLLQQALCLLPNRPEAYFILSRFAERRQWWQDCYIYAEWGIRFTDLNLKPLITDVEYPGKCGLLFQKAISGWWWGKAQESKDILLDLNHNHNLNPYYKQNVIDNLKKIGVDENEIGGVEVKEKIKLSDIFSPEKYNTDKDDLGYLDNFYDEFFLNFKDTPIKMLEIGIKNGGSIKLWKDYLHAESEIYGGDIECFFEHLEGTYSIIGDMYSDEQVSKFSDEYFDIIIDDGPHSFESFVDVTEKYFSKLKKGGSLIIEDVLHFSWADSLVKLANSMGYSSVEVIDLRGKQKNAELLESWKECICILHLVK